MSRVFVLGAGASAGYQGSYIKETCPVSKNFFTKATRVMNIHKIKQRTFSDHKLVYKNLFKFIKDYWNISLTETNNEINLDMEEVMTLLHIEIEEKPYSIELKKACQEYMQLIAFTFDKILYGDPCPHHLKLARNLYPGDVVISFNYELLMDNALIDTENWYPTNGYGVKCYMLPSKQIQKAPLVPAKIRLLKLHGSLNWLYCPYCQQLFSMVELQGNKSKLVYNHGPKIFCHHFKCQGPLQPVVILPTMIKKYHSMPFTEVLWHQAKKALIDAEHIVIIGYSFPPADYRTKWLFRKAMQESQGSRKVTLVNHATGEKLQTMLAYYKNLMRTKEIMVYPTIADYTATLPI